MACIILRPDPQALFDQIQNMFSSTVLGGGKVIPESNEWYVIANDYAAAEQFYAIADQMWRENNPETACCENLYKMAAQHGVFPRPASHAEGYAKLTGVPGTPVPPSLEIRPRIGTFVSVGTVPLTIPDSGEIIIRIRSLAPGPEMNADGNVTTGTLTTPAPGIDAEVAICGGQFCGGAEAETARNFANAIWSAWPISQGDDGVDQAEAAGVSCATRVCVREGRAAAANRGVQRIAAARTAATGWSFTCCSTASFLAAFLRRTLSMTSLTGCLASTKATARARSRSASAARSYAPIPLMVNVFIDIEGCPSSRRSR